MLLESSGADAVFGAGLAPSLAPAPSARRWGVDSEYGRLTDVLVSPPTHLEIVPCNTVAVEAIGQGRACCSTTAARQHRALVRALEDEGVRCHEVAAAAGMPDLCFTRDTSLMTPWGLLELGPSAPHRRGEVKEIAAAARARGIPILGKIVEGHVEGGDVCLLRPGLVAIGWSGERTDARGASALARLFEQRGWTAILTRFDPYFLHLDTLFSLVAERRALACVEALEPGFVRRLEQLGMDLVPVTPTEVQALAANVLSLGDGRILSAGNSGRLNIALADLGYHVVAVDIDQFALCGGGIHCLTMPLARAPG